MDYLTAVLLQVLDTRGSGPRGVYRRGSVPDGSLRHRALPPVPEVPQRQQQGRQVPTLSGWLLDLLPVKLSV